VRSRQLGRRHVPRGENVATSTVELQAPTFLDSNIFVENCHTFVAEQRRDPYEDVSVAARDDRTLHIIVVDEPNDAIERELWISPFTKISNLFDCQSLALCERLEGLDASQKPRRQKDPIGSCAKLICESMCLAFSPF
jgi:hypothetical protein